MPRGRFDFDAIEYLNKNLTPGASRISDMSSWKMPSCILNFLSWAPIIRLLSSSAPFRNLSCSAFSSNPSPDAGDVTINDCSSCAILIYAANLSLHATTNGKTPGTAYIRMLHKVNSIAHRPNFRGNGRNGNLWLKSRAKKQKWS
jgi:hypothetical protein